MQTQLSADTMPCRLICSDRHFGWQRWGHHIRVWTFHPGESVSLPGQTMLHLWWTQRHQDKVCLRYCGLTLSTWFANVAAGHSLNTHTLKQRFSTAGPRPGTGPREILLEFVVLFFQAIFMNKCFTVEIFRGEKYSVNVSKNSAPDVGLRKLQYATRFH